MSRLLIISAVLAALLAASLFGLERTVTREVELELTADDGAAEIVLVDDAFDATSPGCGCLYPELGELEPGGTALRWHGYGIPSMRFDLDLRFDPDDQHDGSALTAFVPDVDVIDWLAVPDVYTVEIEVITDRDGELFRVFRERAGYLLLLTSGEVQVEHGDANPYATLLPAAGGTTRFASNEASRPAFGGMLTITSTVPARGEVQEPEADHRTDTTVTQRGPMIDLLGPAVTLTTDPDARVFAGFKEIAGLEGADSVIIRIFTPFALRLVPHPAARTWRDDLITGAAWADRQDFYRAIGEDDLLQLGPRLQGRDVWLGPVPSYDLHLGRVQVPGELAWASFSERSALRGAVDPMLEPAPVDEERGYIAQYQLPPVTANREVSVFGGIQRYRSDAVRGQVLVGSDATQIARGQMLELESEAIAAGRYRLSPLVSAGQPTSSTILSGSGKIELDGEPITTVPYLRWIVYGIGAALIAFLLTEFFGWLRRYIAPRAPDDAAPSV